MQRYIFHGEELFMEKSSAERNILTSIIINLYTYGAFTLALV